MLLVQLLRQPLRLGGARRLLAAEGGARLGQHLLVLLDRLLLPPQLRLQRAVGLGREESDALVAPLGLDGGGDARSESAWRKGSEAASSAALSSDNRASFLCSSVRREGGFRYGRCGRDVGGMWEGCGA